MRSVYVDTGCFIALVWSRDRAHEAMRSAFSSVRAEGVRLVTCDPVIGETATRLRYDAGLRTTMSFHDLVQQAVSTGQLDVVESSTQLRSEAFELMGRFDDLSLSYADAVGAAVARRNDATSVLGLDNDFRVLGFRLLPDEQRA